MDIRKNNRIFQYLERIEDRFLSLNQQLSSPEIAKQTKKIAELAKELAKIKPMHELFLEYLALSQNEEEAHQLLEQETEPDILELARQEVAELGEKRNQLQIEAEQLIVAEESNESRNVFLEIRAGAGGDESSLFVTDLLRMYSRLSERMKWKFEIVSTTYSSIGGIKEVIAYIKGKDVYKFLQFESGVHRVQRVPVTEASGRIHTSTVTVAVLPEAEDIEIQVDSKDIRIDTYAASGPGGQHVNKTESAIRITHFPTGIVVTCQDEKSQHKNKDKALKVLQARLWEFEQTKQKEHIDQTRRSQVGTGERSEKIRTYNFPQSRVTDHRISSRNFNIEFTMDGDLEDMFDELRRQRHKSLIEKKIQMCIG